ncbi:AAA family ATPase [Dyella sp.]|uniref:AAA family ATPase n=1 Tax=Dyella sp. TaxID=1869338 RepID=UPI002ED0F8E9
MERGNTALSVYRNSIYPAIFSNAGNDSHRDGPLTACVVTGPPGSGKQAIGQRAHALLQTYGLKTVSIAHGDLARHCSDYGLNGRDADQLVEMWRDQAIADAAQRRLGVVVEATLTDDSAARRLLDNLQHQGYQAIGFAVCTPVTSLDTRVSDMQQAERFRASYEQLGWIAECIENHPATTRLVLVDRHGQQYNSNGPTVQAVEPIRQRIQHKEQTASLPPVPRRKSPEHSRHL